MMNVPVANNIKTKHKKYYETKLQSGKLVRTCSVCSLLLAGNCTLAKDIGQRHWRDSPVNMIEFHAV